MSYELLIEIIPFTLTMLLLLLQRIIMLERITDKF